MEWSGVVPVCRRPICGVCCGRTAVRGPNIPAWVGVRAERRFSGRSVGGEALSDFGGRRMTGVAGVLSMIRSTHGGDDDQAD